MASMRVDEDRIQKYGPKLRVQQAVKNNVGQGLTGSQCGLTARTMLGVLIKFQLKRLS